MFSLAISLGHNSSAVLIEDGRVVGGYEEERFSGVKADSRFPECSILELRSRFNLPKDTDCYVGHWFIDAQLPGPNKYWNPELLRELFPDGSIDSLSADFTHHDSHLESAMVFAGPGFADRYHAVVADGFGSFGECISIYEVHRGAYRLLHRVFGFEKSLGMLYQYTTAFMGMRMHNHEYKMLAYEVHATEILAPWELERLKGLAHDTATDYIRKTRNLALTNEFDPVTKIEALPNVQHNINQLLSDVLKKMEMMDEPEYEKRVVISYFVQSVVQAVMTSYVGLYNPTNLLVVGGLFYNVKLNHILANQVKGKFCAMPLAGDQGAALGVYQAYKGDLVWPDNLAWGHRDLDMDLHDLPQGFSLVNNEQDMRDIVARKLRSKGWVNIVRGPMEYGPRALCNTTTLAIPDPTITMDINRANARTMEMPFAPVMTAAQAHAKFADVGKIHKSLEYMIVTRSYIPGEAAHMRGAAHYYPEEGIFTGRPQITSDPMMVSLLEEFGPLVNTSFNFHGVPIVRSPEQIISTHVNQWQTAPELKPDTIVLANR